MRNCASFVLTVGRIGLNSLAGLSRVTILQGAIIAEASCAPGGVYSISSMGDTKHGASYLKDAAVKH